MSFVWPEKWSKRVAKCSKSDQDPKTGKMGVVANPVGCTDLATLSGEEYVVSLQELEPARPKSSSKANPIAVLS